MLTNSQSKITTGLRGVSEGADTERDSTKAELEPTEV